MTSISSHLTEKTGGDISKMLKTNSFQCQLNGSNASANFIKLLGGDGG